MKTTVCQECGATVHFHRGSTPKRCVDCREVNRQREAAKLKARYHNDPEWRERVKTQANAYYAQNPEHVLKNVKAYRQKNKERCAENMLAWQRNNKDSVAKRNRAWKQANPEAVAAMDHNRRMRVRGAEGRWTQKDWKEVLAKFGGVCPCCGTTENLTIDHIVPIAWGGNNFPWNLQPLCGSTNYAKADYAIADYLPWNGEGPRLAFYEFLGPAPETRKRRKRQPL